MKAALIGARTIGSHLYKELTSLGWEVPFLKRSTGIYRDLTRRHECQDLQQLYELERPHFVFIAIPNLMDGKVERDYTLQALAKKIPVVTCAKGNLAFHFEEFQPYFPLLMHTASVGGGSGILRHLKEHPTKPERIYAIVNGTVNLSLDGTSRFDNGNNHASLEEVLRMAQIDGFAEPGASTPHDILNQEVTLDIPMKTSILVNTSHLFKRIVTPRDFATKPLTQEQIDFIFKNSYHYRHFISLTREKMSDEMVGGFETEIEGMHVKGGFRRITSERDYLRIGGVGNTLVLLDENGAFEQFSGEGAGPSPTVRTMIDDAKRWVAE